MYAASTKQPENLSQSALSYLQSLDRATKALRQNQTPEKKAAGPSPLHESSRLSSERGSLSLMISELRQKTRRDSTIDESDDDDKSTSGRRSHLSGKTPSMESSSSTGEERILFDFPFEGGKEESRKFSVASNELPGLHLGRKSISELRQLRTSIDHSLIKPPTLQKQQNTRRRLSSTSRKESSDVRDDSESEEQLVVPRQNALKTKSPFRAAIESGSDVESIDFEEDLPKSKAVRFEESKRTSKTSKDSSKTSSSRSTASLSSSVSESSVASKATSASSSSSSTSSSSTAVTSKSKSSKSSSTSEASEVLVANEVEGNPSSGASTLREYGTDFDSVSTDGNTPRADPSSGKASTIEEVSHRDEPEKEVIVKNPTRKKSEGKSLELKSKQKRVVIPPEKESGSSRRLSSRSLSPVASHKPARKANERKLSSMGKKSRRPPPVARNSSEDRSPLSPANDRPTNSTEDGTQTEESRERHFPEFCSTNVHHVTKDVLRTHLQLLKEFNRLEWTSLQEWNAILDDIREKYDGPSTAKLKAVIEKRTNQFNMI